MREKAAELSQKIAAEDGLGEALRVTTAILSNKTPIY